MNPCGSYKAGTETHFVTLKDGRVVSLLVNLDTDLVVLRVGSSLLCREVLTRREDSC